MVLTIKPYTPISQFNDVSPGDADHPGGKSLINFAVRFLTRTGEVIIDFGELKDCISWTDTLSVEGASGSWTLKMRASLCNVQLLKKLHPGSIVEAYCARNDDPIVGVVRNPATIQRIDTSPEFPKIAVAPPPSPQQQNSVSSAPGATPKTSTSDTSMNARRRAFLDVIAHAEGADYNVMYTGAKFSGYSDHPRQLRRGGGWTSDAAGRYQFLSTTWDGARKALGLKDFSPASQDKAAIYLLEQRGALRDVDAGNFEAAIAKTNKEWASLPGSPYGQPTKSMNELKTVYGKAMAKYSAGGDVASSPAAAANPSATPQPLAPPPEVIGPEVEPVEDPYLDKCPYLLMRGVVTDHGRSTDGSQTNLTVTGESYGKIYKDAFVLVDIQAPDLASVALDVRPMTQQPLGVSLIWYQLLKNWVENFWGNSTGWEARTRQIPFPPNYLTKINNEGSVWSNIQYLAIQGFFHVFTDHTGAICWEKLPWSSRSRSLIAGRNWEDLQLLDLPSWKIISWNDRLSGQGINNFIRCVPVQQGVQGGQAAVGYTGLIFNLGSIRQYGGPVKREITFPIGDGADQYYTSEPLRKQKATNVSFIDLCALECARWYDRPVQRCGVTVMGDAAWRIHLRVNVTEDWHCPDAKPGEYYISGRTHNIDLSRGSWTTSMDLVRDRRTRWLGIGVGDVRVIDETVADPRESAALANVIKGLEKPLTQKGTPKTELQRILDAASQVKVLQPPKPATPTKPATTAIAPNPTLKPPGKTPDLSNILNQPKGTPLQKLQALAKELEAAEKAKSAPKEVEIPPEIRVPLVPDFYFFFDRFQSRVIPIGNDPIAWAKEKVIPRLGEQAQPVQLVPLQSPTGITPPTGATGGANVPFTPVDRIYTASNLYDPTPPGSYDFTLSRGGSGFFSNDQINIPVPSPISGKVLKAGWSGGYGNRVEILGSDGVTWLIAHMNSLSVQVGQTVTRGQAIGIQGWTGSVRPQGIDGTHLHIEFFRGGTKLFYDATRGYIREYFRFVSGGKTPKLNGPSP